MRLRGKFPDGVWFVELAPLADPALVENAIAAVLHLQESPARPLLATLLSHLAQKRALLVIDNCEHVIAQTRRVVGSMLRECPGISLLITSREALSIPGERVYRVAPLPVPSRDVTAPDEAMAYGAVALFADRVRATDARFAVTAENLEPVVEICRRLDGLPLALELAAARAPVLSPWQIAARLGALFDLLGEAHPLSARHETMRAVIDWSYALLSTQGRLLFERLAVFTGGFTLESAGVVCADSALPQEDVLDVLSSLVAQSLVGTEFSRGDARYHLLESTRQYALEKLAEHGERENLARRHARACLAIAERLDRTWYHAREAAWFREARAELDNARAALEWSLGQGRDVQTGCALAGALSRVWYSISPLEGRRWVRSALEALGSGADAGTLAQLHVADAELCGALGEYKVSLAAAERALQTAGGLGELQIARARQAAGSALGAIGRGVEGEKLLEQALAAARQLDNRRLQALALGDLGTARSRSGDVEGARRYYAEALAFYVALGLERPSASISGNLAEVEFAAGDAAAALQRAEEARAGHEATGNRRSMANDLCNMAAYLVALDCFDDARAHATRALAVARDVRATVLTAYVLQHLAAVGALQRGDERKGEPSRERAAMLLGFVDARLSRLEAGREYTERQEYERVLGALGDAMGERLPKVMVLGADWTEEGAAAVALEM